MFPKQQESETLEYKQSLAEKEISGRDICAFANKKGGILFFGMKNDGTCEGPGSITEKTVRDLSQFYHDDEVGPECPCPFFPYFPLRGDLLSRT